MNEVYVSLLNIVSREVVPHFYVFGSGVKHGVFGITNGTRAITQERYMGTLLTKVTQRVCDPKQLWAFLVAATYLASVVDWATLDCLREDQETSEDPKNWQVTEVDFRSTRHPAKSASENQEAKEKRMPSTKHRAQECIEDTWRSIGRPTDVKSSATPKNERTDTKKTGCPALSLSSTRGSWSCSGTSSGSRALRPCPRRAL
jgi:hypothetical protein